MQNVVRSWEKKLTTFAHEAMDSKMVIFDVTMEIGQIDRCRT
jgi:hypothetical protein